MSPVLKNPPCLSITSLRGFHLASHSHTIPLAEPPDSPVNEIFSAGGTIALRVLPLALVLLVLLLLLLLLLLLVLLGGGGVVKSRSNEGSCDMAARRVECSWRASSSAWSVPVGRVWARG